MDLFINGVRYKSTPVTVQQLLIFLKCNKNAIAIEHNKTLLQQESWENLVLQHNDSLEIVTIVGGG
jgi:thiamine biosynthesis protein ThiS|tara:strand:+ start:594 stop:791 length:198 start_codon:yes stop_codon:yes gene_type:complete